MKSKPKNDPIILIVDDQPRNLQVIGNLLADKPYRLGFAQSGAQALESVKQIQPDLILLDVMMPELDGYETCRQLKSNHLTHEIPVIFLTAKSESEDIVEGFRAGGVDYVTKPFQTEELLARVDTHIRLRSLTRQLEEALEMKSELMGIAAHDLKNPLAAIRGLSEIILNAEGEDPEFDLSSEDRADLLRDINQASNNTLTIIKELLNTETIESGIVHLERRECDIGLLIAEVVDLNSSQARIKQITLNNHTNKGLFAYVDEPRTREVLDNLISNAVKYSPIGRSVHIDASMREDTLRVEVRDEGPGLTQEDMKKVFGKFQKLSARPTGGEHSTGLGLAIVKNLVELHGGVVGVDSEEGKGACFYFEIPNASTLKPKSE